MKAPDSREPWIEALSAALAEVRDAAAPGERERTAARRLATRLAAAGWQITTEAGTDSHDLRAARLAAVTALAAEAAGRRDPTPRDLANAAFLIGGLVARGWHIERAEERHGPTRQDDGSISEGPSTVEGRASAA